MEAQIYWRQGEKARLAKAAGITVQRVSDYISGARGMSAKRALKLEAATLLVLGEARRIPAAAWLRLEKHPALV